MAGTDTDTETTLHTEPSAGDPYRDAYEPFRVGDKPEVAAFRQWWLKNPLSNLWTNKPNQWGTFKKILRGASPEEAVKSGANVKLEDITQRGPTINEIMADGTFEVEQLPSDEAWFGQPDPAVYAAGTNHLDKQQLQGEVAKGNVVTLRQLKQHLSQATDEELKVWEQVLHQQRLRDEVFVPLPDGCRVSLWDLYSYVKNNPELKALVDRDPNLVVPKEGMTREERIESLAALAPWKLCGNERHMRLPPDVAAKLEWGLLAGGSWYSRRPTRWLKGLDGVKDFDYGLYIHEEAAQQAMGESWGGRNPSEVLPDRAFYRDALGLAPHMGMTLLAVASRPLPLKELTTAWEQRMKQQIDRLNPASGVSSSSRNSHAGSTQSSSSPQVFLSTSSAAGRMSSGSGTESASGSGSSSEEEATSSSSREVVVTTTSSRSAVAAAQAAMARHIPAAAALAPPPPPPAPATAVAPAAAPVAHTAAASGRSATAQSPSPSSPAVLAAANLPASRSQHTAAGPKPPSAAATAAVPAPAGQQQQPYAASIAPLHDVDPRYRSLAQLTSLFDREHLAAGSELLDRRNVKLREGSTIIFTAHPSGSLLVQAISPGLVKEQKSYVLGEVSDPQLTHALMSMFLDPDYTLDPEFTAAAGACLLGVVNGYRTGRQQQRSSLSILLQGDGEAASRQLLKWAKWSLPDVGKAPQELPLLKGVRREVMYHEIEDAFTAAFRAAAEVEIPEGQNAQDPDVQRYIVCARRRAAEQQLKQRLGGLGLDVSGLALSAPVVPSDLLSLARPLAADAHEPSSAQLAGAHR